MCLVRDGSATVVCNRDLSFMFNTQSGRNELRKLRRNLVLVHGTRHTYMPTRVRVTFASELEILLFPELLRGEYFEEFFRRAVVVLLHAKGLHDASVARQSYF